ncbi:MAG: hypothetical protein U1F66_03435 [bacterium]
MAAKKLQITLCNTCVRDNYGEGIFRETPDLEAHYRAQFKGLPSNLVPEFKQQNCFNYCEQYHCVQVDDHETSILLKKVSDPEKIRSLCDWVKGCAQSGKLELAESLKSSLLETRKIS